MTKNPPRYQPDPTPGFELSYILKYRKPVKCANIKKWGRWYARKNRVVRRAYFNDTLISTVFLGLDCNFSLNNDEPLVFETMIWESGEWSDYQTRCQTWRQALAMHKKAVLYAKQIN